MNESRPHSPISKKIRLDVAACLYFGFIDLWADVRFVAPDGQVGAVLIQRAVFAELQAVALVWKSLPSHGSPRPNGRRF